ncbi:MAG: SGNH/GDSL hydrolase family protein [Gammaproteobacteria bacterium]|nr:SGNH/GDSL hydrolase family protein [Gammaproteobacteria bacterium]
MRSTLARFLLPLCIVCGSTSSWATTLDVFIFGDSLSDTGNMSALSGGLIPPPSYAGVFSNGPVWVDQVAAELGLPGVNNAYVSGPGPAITNYAVGGAYTGPQAVDFGGLLGVLPSRNSNDRFAGAPVFPSLLGPALSLPPPAVVAPSQFELFTVQTGGVAPSDALYVIWGGANDLIFADDFFSVGPAPTASDVALPAVANLRLLIEGLAAIGADDFLLMNLPDIGRTPFGLLSGRAAELSAGVQLFNGALAAMAADVTGLLGVAVDIVDIESLFDDLLDAVAADPVAAGFPDANSLLPGGLSFCVNETTRLDEFCAPFGLDPNDRVFWDAVHPTSATHTRIADAVLARIDAPSPLLLLPLGLLMALRAARRRR